MGEARPGGDHQEGLLRISGRSIHPQTEEMLQTDTIATTEALPEDGAAKDTQHFKPRHPYQVARMLPKDATPEQVDSAIQANFQPKEVRYNTRIDTLTTFGIKCEPQKELSANGYNRESPFAGSPYYNPETTAVRPGVAGDPVPYAVSNDHIITSLLVGIFLLTLFSFAKSRASIIRQAKNFFYVPRSSDQITETASEIRFQVFMVLQTCLLFSLFAFFYARTYVAQTYYLPSQYHLIGIYFLVIAAYYLVKHTAYSIVNWTFFGKKNVLQWGKTFLFINAVEGVVLFPIIMLLTFFNLSMENAVTLVTIVIVTFKLLSFYKCYTIFFRRLSYVLQIILYFCALEVVPLLSVVGAMIQIGDNLKINY